MAEEKRISILGCPVDCLTMEKVVDQCIHWTDKPVRPHQVITVNAQTLVLMHDDSRMKRALETSTMVVADGVSIQLAAKVLRLPLPGRVVGVDLTQRLLEESNQHRLRCYFLGAKPTVVRELVDMIRDRYPSLVLAGYRDGYFTRDQEQHVIQEIHDSAADILFVGMPTPFKETWCNAHLEDLKVPLVIGVGGTFDVLTGHIRRAPLFMQRFGLEWLWRLLMEPRKMWKRNVVYSTRFLLLLARELLP